MSHSQHSYYMATNDMWRRAGVQHI